jgi:hypothetical protein
MSEIKQPTKQIILEAMRINISDFARYHGEFNKGHKKCGAESVMCEFSATQHGQRTFEVQSGYTAAYVK